MKIAVASGKGGVGKSTVASSLAILFSKKKKVVACDCDVDAPNLGLWLGVTKYDKTKKISTSEKAFVIDEKVCKGKLKPEVCRFNAIEIKKGKIYVNPLLCEGCGACELVCKEGIETRPVKNGEIRVTKTKYGFYLVSAQLYPSEKGSGKIVEELKNYAESFKYDVMVIDSAAGIGCPVIASLRGVDYALLVTEPTVSGLTDLQRIMKVVKHFRIPFGIVINKWNINKRMTKRIENKFKNKVLGKLSFDKRVVEAIVNLKPIIEVDSIVAKEIISVFKALNRIL